MNSRKKKIALSGGDKVTWLEPPSLLNAGHHFIRTTGDNTKQHGRILYAENGPQGPVARVELLSWETGEKLSEMLFDRPMLLECEFFADDLAVRWLEFVKAIRADFMARRRTEASA